MLANLFPYSIEYKTIVCNNNQGCNQQRTNRSSCELIPDFVLNTDPVKCSISILHSEIVDRLMLFAFSNVLTGVQRIISNRFLMFSFHMKPF
jgi:hypothetical protein